MSSQCWRCAERVRSGSPYCRGCGAPLAARVEVTDAASPEKIGNARWLTPLALVLVAIAVAALFANARVDVTGEAMGATPEARAETADTPGDLTFALLDRPTETTAVVLTSTRLVTIDLDTNRQEELLLPDEIEATTITRGRRLLLQGQTLLVPNGLETWAIDLESEGIAGLGPGDRVAPAMTPGNAWIWTESAKTWREINASGQVVRQVRWPDAGIPWDHGAGTPELATAPSGGVYRLQGSEEWLLISAGVPLAGNDTSALIQVCESLTLCRSSFIDLETGEAVDRWLPPSLEDTAARRFRISPSGANILEMSPTNRSWEAVFAYSDEVVRSTACMQGWREAAWSEDETLLACPTDRGVTVTDLVRGTAATFSDLSEEPLGVVLVNSAAVDIGR